MHWLSYKNLCKSKDRGGIGFRDFKKFNTALVAKTWWRLRARPETLLGRVFQAVYYSRGFIHDAKKGYRPSYVWSSILRSGKLFKIGGMWKVGDGKHIKAWTDKWVVGDAPLVYSEDLVQQLEVDIKPLIEFVCYPPTARAIMVMPLSIVPQQDLFYWPWTTDGHYSTMSGYIFLQHNDVSRQGSSSSSPSLPPTRWKQL